jgi:hypothetical protein
MKITVFYDVTPNSLLEVYRRFGGSCCLLSTHLYQPKDGGSTFLPKLVYILRHAHCRPEGSTEENHRCREA